MTQQQLPLDLKETRRARIERIALLLNGPTAGRVHQASTFFDEENEANATRLALADEVRLSDRQPNMRQVCHNSPGLKTTSSK